MYDENRAGRRPVNIVGLVGCLAAQRGEFEGVTGNLLRTRKGEDKKANDGGREADESSMNGGSSPESSVWRARGTVLDDSETRGKEKSIYSC